MGESSNQAHHSKARDRDQKKKQKGGKKEISAPHSWMQKD